MNIVSPLAYSVSPAVPSHASHEREEGTQPFFDPLAEEEELETGEDHEGTEGDPGAWRLWLTGLPDFVGRLRLVFHS